MFTIAHRNTSIGGRVARAFLWCVLGGAPFIGCGDEPPKDDGVAIVASAISTSTVVPFFTMGHDLGSLPFGGIGVLDTGSSWSASIELVDIPEGKYVPRYDGYGVMGMNVTGVGAVQGYCEIEWGIDVDQLTVTSGGRNEADIMLSSIPGCDHVGVDRFITNPSYTFDPHHRWAGAVDGENIVAVYVDDIEPLSDLDLVVCDEDLGQDCASSPFGIFPDLPDPPDVPWPDPADWETEEMLLPTDSHGDVVAYLVVKPGWQPTYWEVRFADEEDNVEQINLRVSNLNTITITAE